MAAINLAPSKLPVSLLPPLAALNIVQSKFPFRGRRLTGYSLETICTASRGGRRLARELTGNYILQLSEMERKLVVVFRQFTIFTILLVLRE